MTDQWIVIPNWDKWQSRSDRRDPWIKDWIDQLDRDEYLSLTLAERGLLGDVRRLYARFNGQLKASSVPSLVTQKVRRNSIDSLVHAGYIQLSAAKPPPLGRSRARRERERVRPSKSPTTKSGLRVTGWREVRGTHGLSYIGDPAGTDRPPFAI